MKDCEWCIPDNEVCGTCESYFKDCSAGAEERSCVAWKPMGFCPKCGRDLREGENDGCKD